MDLHDRRIQAAIALTLSEQKMTMAEWLEQPQFKSSDREDLITARKERIWIKEPPKSRCSEKCKAAHSR